MYDRGSVRRRRSLARAGSGALGVVTALVIATAAGAARAGEAVDVELDAAGPARPEDEPTEASAEVPTSTSASSSTSDQQQPVEPSVAPSELDAADPDADDAPRPPRIDGPYLGGIAFAGIGLARVNNLQTDGVISSFGGSVSVGQMVFPWLGLGLHVGGNGGTRSEQGARQTLGQGFLGFEFKFVPVPERLPLSLRASFGFGGGAIRQAGVEARAGYGGAQFGAAVRYELFPWAARRRPYRGGGFGLGPELGWLGFTPAAAGRPMSNVLYLALAATFYFGS